MASGTHWEWRGFGTVSTRFVQAFESCPLQFPNGPPHDITTDEYIWAPGTRINVKLRSGGVQQGLKLKRPVRADGPLELWLEDPRELYPFDQMNAAVMDLLARAIGVTLEPFRSGPFTRERVLDALKTSTPPCIVATIRKKRQARAFSPSVQMELAEIISVAFDAARATSTGGAESRDGIEASLPRPFFSVAVENSRDVGGRPPEEIAAARREVESALAALRVGDEALTPMNYLKAIEQWHNQARANARTS